VFLEVDAAVAVEVVDNHECALVSLKTEQVGAVAVGDQPAVSLLPFVPHESLLLTHPLLYVVYRLSLFLHPAQTQHPFLALLDEHGHHEHGDDADGLQEHEGNAPVADGPVEVVIEDEGHGENAGGTHDQEIPIVCVRVFDKHGYAHTEVEIEGGHVHAHTHLEHPFVEGANDDRTSDETDS